MMVADEINALFSWNPPCLIPVHKTKSSTKSSTIARPSAFYDKHFSSDLVVKRVVPLPSLVQDLARNVDATLKDALGTLPPMEGFFTAEQRKYSMEDLSKEVENERAVADFYGNTTAKYCSRLASTLALHPSFPRWRTLLHWTQSGPSSSYAIMDGQLLFIDEGVNQDKIARAAVVESMDSEARTIFEEVRKLKQPLATWEIKSIPIGSPEAMTAVRNLGEFNWTSCCFKGCNRNLNIHEKAKEWTKEVAVLGPDAQTPPWNIPAENRNEESCIQPPQTPVGQVTRSAVPSGKKRKRDEEVEDQQDTTAQSGASSSILPPPQNGSSMKDEGQRDGEAACQDPHYIAAHNMVQQAWAQAVHVDGTVIVIHSGNQELVCLRHRGSQTLYVSDIIVPSACVDPGYGKLHVGIYVAAIQDMMDRWWQKPSGSKVPDGGGDLTSGDKDQDNQNYNRGSGSGQKEGQGPCRSKRRHGHHGRPQDSVGRKGMADDELAIEKAINVASNCDVVLLYLRYGVYDSPIPAMFLRSAPPIIAQTSPTALFSSPAFHSFGPEECLTTVITSEIGRGTTGVVHRGTLEPEICDGAMPLDVVVKLAFRSEQRDALRNEYEVYRHLKSKGVHQGIATVLGIFDDSEGCACALVSLYAGVSLSDSEDTLSEIDCKSALSILKTIHGAGILHRDIRRANILIGDSGVTIIDFGHSEQCDDQGAKDKELARLMIHCI